MKIDRSRLTPMMQHYLSIKDQHPDAIIMYRLGDFYEMFFEDAKQASRILELALTSRECGLEERAPMCGVPHYVLESYLAKLVGAGHKVAVVEQMEDPKEAQGLVKRSVTRVITPGTLTDGDVLKKEEHNFLLALFFFGGDLGLCYADLSTGEMRAGEERGIENPSRTVADWVRALSPSELVVISEDFDKSLWRRFEQEGIFITYLAPKTADVAAARDYLRLYLSAKALQPFQRHRLALLTTATLFSYIYSFQEEPLAHLNRIDWMNPRHYLRMNAATRENLELLQNIHDRGKKDSLLWALDRTKTAMGSRLLSTWLEFPLLDPATLDARLDRVERLVTDPLFRMNVREQLDKVYDLERLLGKLSYNRGNARDLLALAQALAPLPALKEALLQSGDPLFATMNERLDPLEDLRDPICRAIREDAPIGLTEGGLIQSGYDEALDAVRGGSDRAQQALLMYEASERERTGIKNLRIVYKKNAGYFIEITNSNVDKVPKEYRRRQTMKNAERYTTDELERQAGRIAGNAEMICRMEYEIFQSLREQVAGQSLRIQMTAQTLAELDVLASFAQVAFDEKYCRPHFTDEDRIQIQDGRHPVVERTLRDPFIPNDTDLGAADSRIQIITGPNMAGKSTYMRQVALIQVMAQAGSYVPANACELPIVDQIFTRIGASDHLARGDSTFMVEMKEMAEILSSMTKKSLLILDEVGRGTSTNDGLSIAYAILEYLAKKKPAKTLFATHYHELTVLADRLRNIDNRKVDIEEADGKLLFLRKVVPGKADRSYGIEVARLSGLPEEVLRRADYLLQNIDRVNDVSFLEEAQETVERQRDFSDFQKDSLLQELQSYEVERVSPLEAMNALHHFIEAAKELLGKDNQ